jgi:hypothetical protein
MFANFGIKELTSRLKPLPPDLRAELEADGIRITNATRTVVYEADSVEFKTILEKLLASPLADESVMILGAYAPDEGDKRIWKLNKESPFRELTDEMCRDMEMVCAKNKHTNVDEAFRLFTPARIAIPKIIAAIENPYPERCPITYAFPSGTYVLSVEFNFLCWTFAARIHRK